MQGKTRINVILRASFGVARSDIHALAYKGKALAYIPFAQHCTKGEHGSLRILKTVKKPASGEIMAISPSFERARGNFAPFLTLRPQRQT
ncbi:MAG: hypothetical protein ACKOPC_00100, partial [Methylocystis sp.]